MFISNQNILKKNKKKVMKKERSSKMEQIQISANQEKKVCERAKNELELMYKWTSNLCSFGVKKSYPVVSKKQFSMDTLHPRFYGCLVSTNYGYSTSTILDTLHPRFYGCLVSTHTMDIHSCREREIVYVKFMDTLYPQIAFFKNGGQKSYGYP
jgi:hypothetical protein